MADVTRPNCDNCELLRGDEVVNVLAMAARGELPVCHECERLATLRAEEDGAVYCACDEHRGDFEWEDLSHAAALRAAMEMTK